MSHQNGGLRDEDCSIEELIPLAMAVIYEDARHPTKALAALQAGGRPAVFEVARRLCASDNAKERELGAYILGQGMMPEKNFPEEKFEILFRLLETETNLNVLYAAIFALGHIRDPRAIEHILR